MVDTGDKRLRAAMVAGAGQPKIAVAAAREFVLSERNAARNGASVAGARTRSKGFGKTVLKGARIGRSGARNGDCRIGWPDLARLAGATGRG